MSEPTEPVEADDLRQHGEDPAEGAEPPEQGEGQGAQPDVARVHSEDPAEG